MYDQFDFYHLNKKIDKEKYIIATFSFSAPTLSWTNAVHAIALFAPYPMSSTSQVVEIRTIAGNGLCRATPVVPKTG